MRGVAVNDLSDLVDRYVALWNEPDPDRRRRAVAEFVLDADGRIRLDYQLIES